MCILKKQSKTKQKNMKLKSFQCISVYYAKFYSDKSGLRMRILRDPLVPTHHNFHQMVTLTYNTNWEVGEGL